jgi:integrase
VGEGFNKMGILIPRHTTKCRDRRQAEKYLEAIDALTEWTDRKRAREATTPAAVATVEPSKGLTLIDAMEKWLTKYTNPNTLYGFRHAVKAKTIDVLAPLGVIYLADVKPKHVADLQDGWIKAGHTLSGVLSYRNPCATMFNHFVKREEVLRNPWKSVPIPKRLKPTLEQQVDSDEELDEGRATMPLDPDGSDKNWQSIRSMIMPYLRSRRFKVNQIALLPENFLAFLELLYESGLRRQDAVLFRPDKIRPTASGGFSYKILQGKNSQPVVVFLPQELAAKLISLPKLRWRGPAMKTAGMYPFWDGSLGGLAWIKKYMDHKICNVMREFGETLGLRVADDNSLRAHRFRDSFAVRMLNGGMALQDVSRMLGHASVKMTQDYYLPFVQSSQDALEARKYAARAMDYRAAEAAQAREAAVIVN